MEMSRTSGSSPPEGRGLPPSSRVKQRARFLEVQQRGRKIHTDHFVVTVLSRTEPAAPVRIDGPADGETRLGITVTKKVATAVGRNRVKRWVREVFRCNRSWFPLGSDVVVIAKTGASSLSLRQVATELEGATSRLSSPARAKTSPRPRGRP
jgi:ribonuclease P protein component